MNVYQMKAQTKQLATMMIAHRDKFIKQAITHILGDDWRIQDITGRGTFTVLPDKTEIFSFDGIDMIHFYHLQTVIEHDTIGINMKAIQEYKLLY